MPTNQTLPKGSVATLLCRAGGNPTPEIKWSKDGSPLIVKKRFEIIQGGTLKIDGECFFLNFCTFVKVNINLHIA
jgi:roundabout, axon guidance receptor 2